MKNLNGWNLTGRLIAKHFGNLGGNLAQMIAVFDPETATQADRDQLQEALQQAAHKLAVAQREFKKENDDVVELQRMIDTDTNAAATLLARLEAGTISEETAMIIADDLESNKSRMPQEQEQADQAKAFLEEVQSIVTLLSKKLADFDAKAKKTMLALKSAETQRDMQDIRRQHQSELHDLRDMSGNSNALDALAAKAQKISDEAAGMKIVTDIHQKPLDRAAEVDAIRKSVANNTVGESTADRLRRLSGAAKTAA